MDAGFQLLGPYRGVVDEEVTGWSVSPVSDRGDGHFEVRKFRLDALGKFRLKYGELWAA